MCTVVARGDGMGREPCTSLPRTLRAPEYSKPPMRYLTSRVKKATRCAAFCSGAGGAWRGEARRGAQGRFFEPNFHQTSSVLLRRLRYC
jgi:hypothetical protein